MLRCCSGCGRPCAGCLLVALPSYLCRPPRRTAAPGSQDLWCATCRCCATYFHAPAASSWPACPEQLQPWPARYLRGKGRGAPGPASRGRLTRGGGGGFCGRAPQGSRLSPLGTTGREGMQGGGGGRIGGSWRETRRCGELGGCHRGHGLGDSRSPLRSPPRDSWIEIIHGYLRVRRRGLRS